MASFFKGRGHGHGRGQGSPPPPPPPPPPPHPTAPGSHGKKWISGLVSGAGNIISSVFGSSDASYTEFHEDDADTLSAGQFVSLLFLSNSSIHRFSVYAVGTTHFTVSRVFYFQLSDADGSSIQLLYPLQFNALQLQ
jgi:hypothetical protein